LDADHPSTGVNLPRRNTVKGRWRGDRILGTSEIRYEEWPTTEEVIERGTDISDQVLKYLVAISHY
jgi:hypothetical protein